MLTWHIITAEYPPMIGGVSDYCQAVAEGLAQVGDDVHVWCPSRVEVPIANGVTVHPHLGSLSLRDLRAADRLLDGHSSPRRLLVQWVPHGFGYRSLNVAFCVWLWQRMRRGDQVEIMVHEPYLAFGEGGLRRMAAASVHRVMTVILIHAARRIWIAIPEWERRWRPYALGRDVPFEWLPIPSSLPVPPSEAVRRVRDRYAPHGRLVGHLGSYGTTSSRALAEILPEILQRLPDSVVLLLGQHGEGFRDQLARDHSALAARVYASGALTTQTLAEHVAACDVLVQPYADGISSRRTSAMAGLALGVPVVTTTGHLSEPLWVETGAVALGPAGDPRALIAHTLQLLADDRARRNLGARGRDLYTRCFDLRHTIGALRRAAQEPCESRL